MRALAVSRYSHTDPDLSQGRQRGSVGSHLVFRYHVSLALTPSNLDGILSKSSVDESCASQGRGIDHIIPGDNDNMLSGCEQLGDSRYHRRKSHRGFAPSFAAEHRRGSYEEQRSPGLAGKCGRRP